PAAPTARAAWTARIAEAVAARAQPREQARAVRWLSPQAPYWGGPEVLLVLGSREVDGELWLDLLVKGMPAGSHGWIPASAARLARTDRRIVVDLSERSLVFQRGGRTQLRTRVVVGAPATPTPVGQFAVDAIAPEPRGSLLGPRVLALVAYSRALARYQGGIPQAAIHASELIGDPLGTAVSHGCVRAPQALVNRLLTLAPRGTPVLIQR
ncbi:L,D-transpeptidase, partial [Conexibacter sp. JD483]|uniref:L,D-transpeptidase n=2 Tax=Conexibacter TaxID=191494 RepID=UPI00287034A0